MSTRVFQRFDYDGVARELGVWWTLRKDEHAATCRMFSHVFGHELRLEVKGELAASQVCRTDAEILDVQERWRVAMNAKGWRLDSGTKATDGHAHENTT